MPELKAYRKIMLPWVEFAQRHDAKIEVPQPEYSDSDSNFIVSKENEFELYFQWGGVPNSEPVSYNGQERNTSNDKRHRAYSTNFYFPIASSDLVFKIHQRNWATAIYLLFKSGKIKIGDSQLDKKYVFVSNKAGLFISEMMKEFDSNFNGISFMIETEGEEMGVEKRICIQVNNLLRSTEEVERFFKLGILLQREVNRLIGF